MSFIRTPDPELSIKLECSSRGRLPGYIPGETIVGVVRRIAPGAIPEAQVAVTLHGKCTSKIKIRIGNSESRYESSFNCLSAPMEPQIVFPRAPLHIPEGEEMSWPFAITIPTVVQDVRRRDQRKLYVLLDGPNFPPPASFATYSDSSFTSGEKSRASVEYYVQAKIELVHVHRGFARKTTHTATAPFRMKSVNIGPPITDFNLKRHQMTHTVVAYKLVPGTRELSFGQKTRQTFMTSSVPRLTFKLNVILPHTLQVENTSPIPICLSAEPVVGSTSEIIHDVPQTIIVKSFMLRLKQRTRVQAEDQSSENSVAVNLIPENAISALGREVSLTVTPCTGGQSEESAPINIGEMLDFRMRRHNLHPTFKTYNVGRSYDMAWEVEGRVAGEKFKLGFMHQARVLPGPHELLEFERPAPAAPPPGALPEYPGLEEAPPAYSA
ncbi:hypothetical protein BJY01DRAFT_244587 [Aspergillus pseudoustus]|uniref:Arrestin-like N-terminal domain-containing protein n=1 Tax=Aspergillus pseudoustus TaxID=1810923 RepID=A0ABR4KJF0_9EURO